MRYTPILLALTLSLFNYAADDPDDAIAAIHTVDGKTIRAKSIDRDDCYIVSGIDLRRGPFRVPAYRISSVHYASDANHELAIEKRNDKKYRLAAMYFQKAIEKTTAPSVLEECKYGMADALMKEELHTGWVGPGGTVYPMPAESFEQILNDKPDSRYKLEISLRLPLAYAHQNRFDTAQATLEKTREWLKEYKIKGVSIDPDFNESNNHASARLALVAAQIARLQVVAKTLPESNAAEIARKACSATLKYGALRAEAFTERLGSLLRLKDFSTAQAEAESLLNEIDAKKDPGLSAARDLALLILGYCHLESGNALLKQDQRMQANQQFAEARWNFLNVIAGCADNDRHVPAAHYYAAQCSEKLSAIEEDAARGAASRRRLLIERFPDSSYAELAQSEIKKKVVR